MQETDPSFKEPLVSDIPTLVLAGEFDPVTPPEYGQRIAESLSRGYFFGFPGVSHDVNEVSECARGITAAFLEDPSRAPNAGCIADMGGIEWAVPADLDDLTWIPVTVPEYGIRAVVPEGWRWVRPEYTISPDQSIELVIKDEQDEDREAFLAKWGASEMLEEIKVNDRTWTVYPFQGEDRVGAYAGYIATAPSEKGFYMVLVVGSGGKQADLYETILRPVVEAFTTDGTLPPSDAETDGGEIKLVPYTSDDFGISGLVPEGWTEVTPGTFARGSSATDQTALIQKSFPGLTIEQLKPQLLPVLRIEELPEPVGTYESEALTWALYAVEIEAPGLGTFVVDVALAETEDGTFIILFQALKEDHDALHEAIFLPAVDALAPVGE